MVRLGIILALMCLLLSSVTATAGPWAREKGKIFVAASGFATWPNQRAPQYPDVYGSGYGEYGLGRGLTAGIDLGSSNMKRTDKLKAIGFLRYTLTAPDAPVQAALDFGGGIDLMQPTLRLGASLGYGFQLWDKGSWLSIDWATLHAPEARMQSHTLDITLGMSLKHGKIMGQLSGHESYSGMTTVSFTPSYVRPMGEGRYIEVGANFGLMNKPDPALKFGVWQEF
jgi:hypothetical protein